MDLTGLIEQGAANPILLFVMALILGGLHGLEPGHSKTMMAAYIIATKGTVGQAILLGVSAAFSHSIIVWVLAYIALAYGNELIGEQLEPYFIAASGVIVIGIAVWMFWQAWQADRAKAHRAAHALAHEHAHALAHAHGHNHGHDHDHHHHDHLDGDAHARAHAAEIEARLADGRTGTWQTVLFGLSGGLIPCPAAITVFLLCVQLGQFGLGITLVSAFSLGLALTLVLIGMVAAMGIGAVSQRAGRYEWLMNAAPYLSAGLIAAIGGVMLWVAFGHSHLHLHAH
ncbi:MAG: nickel/cobalt efflux transporter [Pseudomonadota bacterium]